MKKTISIKDFCTVYHDKREIGLFFFCHCVDGFAFPSHIDYESGLYKFDDGICDFNANVFDCRDSSDKDCIYRKNFDDYEKTLY